MPGWGWKCHNENPLTRKWSKPRSRNCIEVLSIHCEKNCCSMTNGGKKK